MPVLAKSLWLMLDNNLIDKKLKIWFYTLLDCSFYLSQQKALW